VTEVTLDYGSDATRTRNAWLTTQRAHTMWACIQPQCVTNDATHAHDV